MTNSIVNRLTRIVFGSGLILATMSVSTAPLGGFAVLPLIAVPMILSGLFGENPIGELTAGPVKSLKVRAAKFTTRLSKRNAVAA